MIFKTNVLALAALCGAMAMPHAAGQPVYKCGRGFTPTYSDRPCSGRIVNTDEAPVPAKTEREQLEQDRLIAQTMRRLPAETTSHFEMRRRRARLPATDRDECARLDTRIPVEQAGVGNPDPEESAKFEGALANSRRRFSELRC